MEKEQGRGKSAEWGQRMVGVIAQEVRRHRTKKGWSAQRLSDRCAELGFPIKRSVLSNLESGYRETITVPEVLVLALALEVPPILLMLPIGQADSVEIAPGVTASPMEALNWMLGHFWLPGFKPDDGRRPAEVVHWYETHSKELGQWEWAQERIREEMVKPADAGRDRELEYWEHAAARSRGLLRNLRALMRTRELVPPPVPDALNLD